MKRVLPYLVLMSIILCLLTFGAILHPDDAQKLIVQMDIFKLTAASQAESQRLNLISTLPVDEYWKKEALIKGQVFKGATPEMASLALGTPVEHIDLEVKDYGTVTILIYLFEGSSRYTMLQFIDNKLDLSQQIAAPDVEMYRRDPRRVEPRTKAILPVAAQSSGIK